MVNKYFIDILCISESWLQDTITDGDVAIEDFSIDRRDRRNRIRGRGGGVAIYVENGIMYSRRNDIITDPDLESVWLEVKTSCQPILVCCMYRAPGSLSIVYDHIIDTFENASKKDEHMVILGDLNQTKVNPITPNIIRKMTDRDKNHHQAISCKHVEQCTALWNQYRRLRNDITNEIRQLKRQHYHKVLLKPGRDSVTTSITPDEFNDYFSIIGHNVVSSNITVNDEYKWKLPESIYTFKFSRISVDDVYKLLSALPDRSNNDILDFDAKLLRMTAPIIAPSLTMIFNASIINSYFVNDWKFAKVLPAYKGKGSAQDKINYRPLSLVMHIAKILERIIQIQLMTYMDEHAFITIDQSAYLKKHSTQTSLHRLIDDILENRNNNEITGLCFLDIQKCFDTIDHTILLDKLSHYGIRTVELRWFQSYLTDRMQSNIQWTSIGTKRSINRSSSRNCSGTFAISVILE